jgi:hypothetical protein
VKWHLITSNRELEVTIDSVAQIARAGLVASLPAGFRHSVKALTDGRATFVDHRLRPDFNQPHFTATGVARSAAGECDLFQLRVFVSLLRATSATSVWNMNDRVRSVSSRF